MDKILVIFNAPYPLEEDRRRQFIISIIISIMVVVILFLFKPFGLGNVTLPVIKLIPVYIGYGLVTLLVAVVADTTIVPAFPSFFNDQKWNVGRHILWTVFIIMNIGLANMFYSWLLGFTGISGTSMLTFQFYTIVVSIIPVTIITMITRIRLLSKNLKIAIEINQSLTRPVLAGPETAPLIFESENGKETLHINSDQFLFAESADNYTDVVYLENGIIKRDLIRSTLKRVEEANAAEFIIRVHRGFLVNMLKVKEVVGNSQGYRLLFENIEDSVPVARRSSAFVKEVITRYHHS